MRTPAGNLPQQPRVLLKRGEVVFGLLQPAHMPLHCHGMWESLLTSHTVRQPFMKMTMCSSNTELTKDVLKLAG